jgi:tetratricopeptide (TPR) repeat protein
MPKDAQGLAVTMASEAAAAALDHAVAGYLGYRADAPARVKALLAADPEAPMAHVLKGAFAMLAFNAAYVPAARAAAEEAARRATGATTRERAHVAALSAWAEGELDRALATWRHVLSAHPHDVLAYRLHHFVAFWLGRPGEMAAAATSVRPTWSAAVPAFPAMLGCFSFAAEELGDQAAAERDGRAAVAADPADLWAAHAVAHVLEMTGREEEGIAWTEALAPNWEGANQLVHHLWWHRALFHFDRGETEAVLALYDTRFRDTASPLVLSHPDLYVDVQNAASMLWRLRRLGVPAGDRWEELADKAEARAGDILSAFTLPHWMMALVGAERWEAARRWLEAARGAAAAEGQNAVLVREVALPVCEAILAAARSDAARAVSLIRPVAGRMAELGGSHAQQDVLWQVYLDAAMSAGDRDAAREAIAWSASRFTTPPSKRAAWARAAAWAGAA